MATPDEVISIIGALSGVGLDFAPRNIEAAGELWIKALEDVPGDLLAAAAGEYLKTSTRWPQPAVIRELAWKAKLKGETPGRFNEPMETTRIHGRAFVGPVGQKELVDVVKPHLEPGEIPGVFRITADGWKPWKSRGAA